MGCQRLRCLPSGENVLRRSASNLDPTRIIYNAGITLAGIPEHAHEYRLGSRSALDWLIDRYQVTTHKASGIVNDPNDWATEHDEPRYIVDLVKRITTVSVQTVEIVRNLPYQKFGAGVELVADHWLFVPDEPVDAERFQQLADQWEDETMYLSNPTRWPSIRHTRKSWKWVSAWCRKYLTVWERDGDTGSPLCAKLRLPTPCRRETGATFRQ